MLLLLASHCCVVAHAQEECTGSLRGHIRDEDGNPLIGAAVILTPGKKGQITDAQGAFKIESVCDGSYVVEIQYIGYEDVSVELQIVGNVTRDFALTEAITELKEVIVQHHDDTNTEHATNYTALNERQLAEYSGKSLGEMIKEVPGVTSLQTGPGIFKPVIHGVHSQRLLILNHGIRQEGQQWGAEHAPEIDPFIASSIVVIKDASAIKYGTNALGGVVVVNPPPVPLTNELAGTFSSILNSNGRSATLSGMIEGGIEHHQGWGWRVQGTARRAGDFETPDYVLTNTGVKELDFSAAAGYHGDKQGVDVFFSRFHTEIGILQGTAIGNLDDLASAMERDRPLYTADFSYDISEPRQEASHHLLKINGHIEGRAGDWRVQYAFQNNDRKEFDLRRGDLSKIPAIDLKLNTHSLDAEWEKAHTGPQTIAFGVNAMAQTNENIPGTQRIPFIPDFDNISGGLYAITKIPLADWTVDAGLRYDYRKYNVKGFDFKNALYSASFAFNNVSATLGVTRKLDPGSQINLNVSTSWRPPHVAELYSIGTHQSAAAIEYGLMLDSITNEVLDINDVSFSAEQALKAVASYQVDIDRIHFSITPYVNYIFNYIYLRPEGITRNIRGVYPYFRYRQTDALFFGVDIDAAVKISKHVVASPRVSLLRARDIINDDYFLFVPSNRFAVNLRYERPVAFGFGPFYIESKTQYVVKQTASPKVITVHQIKEAQENDQDPFNGDFSNFDFAEPPAGYFLWDLAAGISVRTAGVQYDIRLASENVLNKTYREYTNRLRYYADDLGRNFSVSIKCIF